MDYLRFLQSNRRLLAFGFLATAFGSVGQTFLISLFMPQFLSEFGLSKSLFGALYSGATLFSALSLPAAGQWIDRIPLRRYSLAVGAGLAVAASLTAWSPWLPVLFVGIFGLRFTGQGLLVHIATTTMARYFDRYRGKALSLVMLGAPAGEAVLPMAVTAGIANLGWRTTWLVLAGAVALGLLPALGRLIGREVRAWEPAGEGGGGSAAAPRWSPKSRTRREVLRDRRFYLLLPGLIVPPFFLTGLFLFQVPLAEWKGWEIEWLAAGFVVFSACRVLASLAAGVWVDRLSATRVVPYYLIPLFAGLAAARFGAHPLWAFVFLGGAGATVGIGANVKSALWAEIYGIQHLGAIKSLMFSLMILSTSAAPVLVGGLLDAGIGFDAILMFCLVSAAASSGAMALAARAFRVEPPAHSV